MAYDSKGRLCWDFQAASLMLAFFHLAPSDDWSPQTIAHWPLLLCALGKAFPGCSPTQGRLLELATPKRIKHRRTHVNYSYSNKQEKKRISISILHKVGGEGIQQIICYLKSRPTSSSWIFLTTFYPGCSKLGISERDMGMYLQLLPSTFSSA